MISLIACMIAGFAIAAAVGWRIRRGDAVLATVVDAIVRNYLDEKRFNAEDLRRLTGLSDAAISSALTRLERSGLITHTGGGSYRLKDPLVFLTERDYDKAMRITANDNILYGAYQNPYLSKAYLLLVYGIFLLDLVFVVMAYVGYLLDGPFAVVAGWVMRLLPPGREDLFLPFLLFLLGMGLIFVDFMDNIIKAWARERYMVVVGEKSGVSYDRSFADELSGRIGRGQIRRVDLDITPLQKFINYFRSVPLGNVKVTYEEKGAETTIEFKNMPFPRELFNVIRDVQLGALEWRKRHAGEIALWRAGVAALVPRRRRR